MLAASCIIVQLTGENGGHRINIFSVGNIKLENTLWRFVPLQILVLYDNIRESKSLELSHLIFPYGWRWVQFATQQTTSSELA